MSRKHKHKHQHKSTAKPVVRTQEHENYLKRRSLAMKAVLVGALSGLVAVGFRLMLERAEKIRSTLLIIYDSYLPFIPALLFTMLILMVIEIVRRIAPESAGSGIPHLKGVIKEGFAFSDIKVLLTKFVGGIVGIGSGLALGREGPTVQMGGAVGSICSRFLKTSSEERNLLICAGAGSGLAAAFNAPFAGLLFVLEELQQRFDRHSMVVAFSATISANLVCRGLLGPDPIFNLRLMHYPGQSLIYWCVIFGVVLGYAGLIFNTTLLKSLKLCANHKLFLGLSLGLLFGFLGFFYPDLLGMGHHLNEKIMQGAFPVNTLILFFIARFAMTILSYNTGAPGGIFAPLLLLGALLGAIFFNLVDYFQPQKFDLVIFLVLGMGGLFSAIVRSPITGVVLILEMTNEFHLLLPLMVISIMAYSVPEFYLNKPIYDALLDADLEKRKQAAGHFEHTSASDHLR